MNDDETEKRLCSTCGKEAALKCSRCRHAVYCNAQCQSSDWKEHKKNCFTEGSTCTRCLQVIDKNAKCTVSHPAHMLQDQGASFGRGSCSWNFACNACKGSFVKTSTDSNGMATAPITTGAPFCYVGPHTIKPLPAEDLRRSYPDLLLLYAGPDLQQQINNIPTVMPNVKFLVIQSTGSYNEAVQPSLEILMPKLQTIKLIDVPFSKINLNMELTPLVEEVFMQNIPDHCVLTVQLPELKSFSMHYYGPTKNDQWFHDMLCTAKRLRTFDSYKLRIRSKIHFAGNDLQSIRLHRAECLTHLSIYAPNLVDLSLQACYNLADGDVMFLDSHPNFTRPPTGRGSKFTVDTTNACLNESIIHTLQSHPRVIWSGPDDEDEYQRPTSTESLMRNSSRRIRNKDPDDILSNVFSILNSGKPLKK